MCNIALSLSDPTNYRSCFFSFQFRHHYVRNVNYDLSEYESFVNLGDGERNTFNALDQ